MQSLRDDTSAAASADTRNTSHKKETSTMILPKGKHEEAADRYEPADSSEPGHVDYLMAGGDNEDAAAVHMSRIEGGPKAGSSHHAQPAGVDQQDQDDEDDDGNFSDEERTSPTRRLKWYAGAPFPNQIG